MCAFASSSQELNVEAGVSGVGPHNWVTALEIAATDSSQLHNFARNLKLEEGLVDSPWFKALENRDCKTLKGLLQNDKEFVRKTSFAGRTVLHVAVIQGCLDLVEYILKLFGDGLETAVFTTRYEVLLRAKDGRCGGVTALGLAQEFLGMEKIIRYLQFGPSDSQRPPAKAQEGHFLRTIHEIISRVLTIYKRDCTESHLEHEFHEACSKIAVENPIQDDFEFVQGVVKQCLVVGVPLLRFLVNLRDSQGKPPFHKFLASRPDDYPVAQDAMSELIDGIPKEGVDVIYEAYACAEADYRFLKKLRKITSEAFLKVYKKECPSNEQEHEFHNACCKIAVGNPIQDDLEFIQKVVQECLDVRPEGVPLLRFLLNLPDTQGNPPFHYFVSRPDGYDPVAQQAMRNLIVGMSKQGVDLVHEAFEKALDREGKTFCCWNVQAIIKKLVYQEFDHLKVSFDTDAELVFHLAFKDLRVEESDDGKSSLKFVQKVMIGCLDQHEVGVTTLKFLFNLPDTHGKPPLHNFLASRPDDYDSTARAAMSKLIHGIPGDDVKVICVKVICGACVEAVDAMGRTICHWNVHGIIRHLFMTEPKFEFLKASFDEDVDYNFYNIESNFELMFHHAFSKIGTEKSQEEDSMKFVRKVMDECLIQGDVGVETLKFLFNLPNAQGRPPFHVLLASSENGYDSFLYPKVNELIDWLLLKREPPVNLDSCVKALDAMGRTIFHRNVSMKPNKSTINYVFEHKKIASFTGLLNERMKSTKRQGGATALHLAILHNQDLNLEKLLEFDVDLNAMLYRRIQYGHGGNGKGDWWSPLQLAALVGKPSIVKILLAKIEQIYDVGKWKNNSKLLIPNNYDAKVPALHLAVASGNSEILRLFLNDPHFNQMKAIELIGIGGNGYRTALHLAADETIPVYREIDNISDSCPVLNMIGPLVNLVDVDSHHMLDLRSISMLHEDGIDASEKIKQKVYNGKKRCMIMLVEAGSDIWQKDENGDFLEPRWEATDGDSLWWHDRIRMQVIEAKRNLNAAGNAISVVAGLVATASYAGPLQPPLGTITDLLDGATVLQVHHNLAVRIFVISNSISFFLAIVALMLSLMPSLPVSQESLHDEWRHARGTVSSSLIALLMSVLSILVSFAAASCAGMPDYKSVLQSYAFYPCAIGGLMCLVVIVLCFTRVLRLIRPENKAIKSMYKLSIRVFNFLQ